MTKIKNMMHHLMVPVKALQGTFSRRQWRALGLGGIALAAVLGLAFCAWFFYPLELMELQTAYHLKRAGVVETLSEGPHPIHAYTKDTCSTSSACTCVALVHGLGDNGLTWKRILETTDQEWAQAGLASPLKIVAVDLPGSGKSPPPTDRSEYRVRTQAKILADYYRHLCPSWIVVGNSLGGWIAAWMALQWDGVSRLILLSPAGIKTDVSMEAKKLLSTPTVESLKEFQRKAYFKPRPIPERVWTAIVRKAQSSNSKEVSAAQVEDDDLNVKLATLSQPTLVIWGMADQIIPLKVGHQMRDLNHALIWREVPECGHMAQKECPKPVLTAIVDMLNFGMM